MPQCTQISAFAAYALVSGFLATQIVYKAVSSQKGYYDTVLSITSYRVNMLLLLNFLFVCLLALAKLLVWIFFKEIRTNESEYILEKVQRKIFKVLLMSVLLRRQLDLYKVASLTVIMFIWMLHWLVTKRSKGLIGEENRTVSLHVKMQFLFGFLITFDGFVTYLFVLQFMKHGTKMNDIYQIVGFDFACIFLKVLNDNFKYQVNLIELYLREQWLEKKFIFNCLDLVFDLADMYLNLKLFHFILQKGILPIYLLGDILDDIYRLFKACKSLYTTWVFIKKLKSLPDVRPDNPEGGESNELQCCICLGNIAVGKTQLESFTFNCKRQKCQ